MSPGRLQRQHAKAIRRKKMLAERDRLATTRASPDAEMRSAASAPVHDNVYDQAAYDAARPPDPSAWLALDEAERLDRVDAYYRRARLDAPGKNTRTALVTAIETQIAEGDAVVSGTVERMMDSGLQRLEALHAVATVLIEQMRQLLLQEGATFSLPAYHAALHRLTRESWEALAQ